MMAIVIDSEMKGTREPSTKRTVLSGNPLAPEV